MRHAPRRVGFYWIEDNHSLLIQLVDGQQTRLARLEDRLEGGR